MIGPVSSQPNVVSQQVAAAPAKVENAAPKAPPAPAPYNAMKEKLNPLPQKRRRAPLLKHRRLCINWQTQKRPKCLHQQ
jgi:hypothetical protein